MSKRPAPTVSSAGTPMFDDAADAPVDGHRLFGAELRQQRRRQP